MLTHNILTQVIGYIADSIDVTYNGTYFNQTFKKYSHLASQATIGASVNLGASLNSDGTVAISGGIGASYGINTAGLDIDIYPVVSGLYARQEGVGPGKSQITYSSLPLQGRIGTVR